MDFLYLIFYGCLRLRFLDVEANPSQRCPVPVVWRILCSNVRGLAGNLSELTVASSQYDILLCSETFVSDMRHVTEVLVPRLDLPVLLCRDKMPRARGMAAYVWDGYRAFRHPKFECGCCEMLFFSQQPLAMYKNSVPGCRVAIIIVRSSNFFSRRLIILIIRQNNTYY